VGDDVGYAAVRGLDFLGLENRFSGAGKSSMKAGLAAVEEDGDEAGVYIIISLI